MKGVLVIGFGSGEFICQKGEFLLIDCHMFRLCVGPATSLANQLALVEHVSRIKKQEQSKFIKITQHQQSSKQAQMKCLIPQTVINKMSLVIRNQLNLEISKYAHNRYSYLFYFQMEPEDRNVQDMKKQLYSRQQYAKANFWDERYSQKGGFFDWYAQYPELKHSFAQYDINKEDRILMVGCGNSKLSGQMFKAGYCNIVNIDISPSVIDQMRNLFPEMVWQVMDATKMSYKDVQFDVIIDKGTLDALISGKNYQICTAMLRECVRVMKQAGQLLLITYGSPQGRKKIYETALPLQKYDYYQCRAELNDISTMINLMRSNLGGQKLNSIVKDTAAFSKSMKEFSIIKMMRKNRKNTKQFIVWSGMQKAKIQVNPNYIQQSKQANKQYKQPIQSNKGSKNTIKTQQVPTQKGETQNPKQQFTYEPKKQSFVYVYSIRHKFAINMQKIVGQSTLQQLTSQLKSPQSKALIFSGNILENPPFNFCLQKQNQIQALRAAKYLKQKGISFSSFTLNDKELCQSKYLKVNIIFSQSKPKVLAIRKTNFNLRIKLTPKYSLQKVLKMLTKLPRHITDACKLHPCPKTYALFDALKCINIGSTVNSLLQKYWFPTYVIRQINQEDVELSLSVPPVTKQKQTQIIEQISIFFKPTKSIFSQLHKGYLSYVDLQLTSIVSMACLSYSNQKVELTLQQFWENDQFNQQIKAVEFAKNQSYNQIKNIIALPKEILSKVLAHILAFY